MSSKFSLPRIIVFGVAVIAATCALASLYGAQVAVLAFLTANACFAWLDVRAVCGPTLTSSQVLLDIIQSFRKKVPGFNRFGLDLRATPLKLNQSYIAHIAGLPTVSTYDTTTGYANGANAARGLLADVSVTVSNQPTCPLKWLHLDQLKDIKNRYDEVIGNAGYAMAKDFIDDLFAQVNSRNFTKVQTIAAADFDYDALMTLSGIGNTNGMMNNGRTLFVNTTVANYLFSDSRIISKDFAGQIVGGEGYRRAVNVGGFAEIVEYPDLPSNNGTALTGVTAEADDDLITKAAHGLETGDPFVLTAATGATGLVVGTKYWAIKVSASTFQAAASYALAVAGTEIDITVDGSAMTITPTENLHAFAFDKRALAVLAGIPEGIANPLAQQLGIPQVMAFDSVTDPDSLLSMAAAKWQEAGTGDFFWCPTFVWGATLGKGGYAAAADAGMDKAGLRIITG